MSDLEKDSALSLLEDAKLKQIVDEIQSEQCAKIAQGGNFNIFSVLGIEYRETYVCKMIGDLLSPQGKHGLGSVFIKHFFKQKEFTALNISDTELENATVVREDSTNEGRRIDLTIQTASWIIPIEAKIDAGDQPNQCADYFFEIEDRAKIYGRKASELFYLTLDGRRPSSNSMISRKGVPLPDSKVITITWNENILAWLEDCCNLDVVQQRNIVFINIRQLIDNIKEWKNSMDNKLLTYIKTKPENLDRAIQIWRCMELKKENIWDNFIKPFIRYADDKKILLGNGKFWFECIYKKDIIIEGQKLDISLFLGGDKIVFRVHQGGEAKKFDEIGLDVADIKKSNIFPSDVNWETPQNHWCINELPYPTLDDEGNEHINFTNPVSCPSTMKLLSDGNMKDYLNFRVMPCIKHLTKGVISCAKETQDC